MKLIYSPDRFMMPKMYHTGDISNLNNYENMLNFISNSVKGQNKLYWDTEKIPRSKYTQKVVGEDFEKRILENNKDTLLFVYHPLKEKNLGLEEKFEEFAKSEGRKNENLLIARYNGINESMTFKSPQKLPAILLFKKKEGEDQKDVKEF
jgi:hypothetical protein